MKKTAFLLCALILSLSSCATQKQIENSTEPKAAPKTRGQKSLPVKKNTCTVFKGEEYSVEEGVYNRNSFSVISLVGNGSTGYSWEFKLSEEGLLKVENDCFYHGRLYEQGVIEKILPDGTKISYKMPEIAGAGTTYFWKLIPLEPYTDKTVTMTFDYRCRWETEPPLRQVEYLITIKKDGTINCVRKAENTVPRG